MSRASLKTSVKAVTYPALIIYELLDAKIWSKITVWTHRVNSSPLISAPAHSHSASCLFTHQDTSVQASVRFMAQRSQISDEGTVKKQQQKKREMKCLWDAQPTEKMDQWDRTQLIHNQCDCEWWARRVNKQIRFKRTANQFAVTQRKLNTARITF